MTPEQRRARNRALAQQEVHRRKGRELGYGETLLNKIRRVNREDALNLLLSHQCHNGQDEQGWTTFHFPLHCDGIVEIVAKKKGRMWIILSSRFIDDPQ